MRRENVIAWRWFGFALLLAWAFASLLRLQDRTYNEDPNTCIERNTELAKQLSRDSTTPPQVIANRMQALNKHTQECREALAGTRK